MSKSALDEAVHLNVGRYLKRRNFVTSIGGSNNSNCLSSQLQGGAGRCTIKELIANELMTSVGSFDNLIQCSVHNASAGTPAQQHTIISSGLRREGPAHSPIAAATDYFADCDTCMTRLVQITKQLSDRVQANTIRLGAFMHLFVELFQNEYRADAKRFYTKHVACLAHPTGNSAVLDLLANSIKCGQLDKRLVKLRQAKTCVRVDWRFSRHLQNIFETQDNNHLLFQLFNNHFCISISDEPSPATRCASPMFSRSSVDLILPLPFTMPYSCQHLLDDRDRHTGMFKMKKPTYKKCSEHDKDEDDDDESKQNSTRLSEFHDICSRVARLLPSCPKMYAFRVQRDDTRVVCADISLSGSKYAVGLANSQIDVISIQSQSLFNLQRAVTGSSHVRKFVLDAEYPDTFCESPPPLCSAAQSTLYGHSDAITSVRFCSKDDRLMLSSATDGVVKCWQQHRSGAPKWQTVATYAAHLQPVWSLDVNTLDTHFCTASRDHSVRLFSLDHPQVLRVLAGHQAPVNVVRFHPNCRYVASGANDYSVRLWDILSGRLVRVLVGHVQPVYTLAFSPDGRFLASAGDDRSICIWDLSGGRLLSQVRTVHTQTINSLQFSADGRFLTSASLDQLVCVWNVQSTEATRLEQALVKDTGIALLHIQFAHSDLLLGVGT